MASVSLAIAIGVLVPVFSLHLGDCSGDGLCHDEAAMLQTMLQRPGMSKATKLALDGGESEVWRDALDVEKAQALRVGSGETLLRSASTAMLGQCRPVSSAEKLDLEQFKEIFEKRSDSSPKMKQRMLNTDLLGRSDAPPDGLWLKFGVDMSCDKGTCDKLGPLAEFAAKRQETRVYGFDWFHGLPETWRRYFGQGSFSRDKLPIPPKGVEWVVGKYQDSLPKFLANQTGKRVGYLMVDSDLCSSAEFILEQVYPRFADHAVVYFDEIMNFESYDSGEFLAFFRFLRNHKLDYEVLLSAANFEPTPSREDAYNQQAAFRLKPL